MQRHVLYRIHVLLPGKLPVYHRYRAGEIQQRGLSLGVGENLHFYQTYLIWYGIGRQYLFLGFYGCACNKEYRYLE